MIKTLHFYRANNILSIVLALLKIRHTNRYTSKYFNEHPHKYNMFGISKMLAHYEVRSKGIRVEDKEKSLQILETPFIAHVGNNFVAVEAIQKETITYYANEERLTIPINKFIGIWSGATLVVEATEDSIEPQYKEHRKQELVTKTQKGLLFICVSLLIIVAFLYNHIYSNIGLLVLLFINLMGIYTGYLLVLKQMNIQSNYADKICSLFSQSNCNNILNSPAAKFMGVIGWSELGLSYFISNTFIVLFIPQLLPYLVLLNICALPYSFWSVWYQKFKAKTWCPLCLIVQVLFWSLFINNLIFGFIHLPEFNLINILMAGLIYALPFLIISVLLPQLSDSKRNERITHAFNSLKMDDQVFKTSLQKKAPYEVNKDTSSILLGNPDAQNLITVFTNPHCNPCAYMHNRINNLLKETNNFCIQYILSSFTEELDTSCEFFLFVNRNYERDERDNIYDEWFNEGKYKRDFFFQKYKFQPNGISDEYERHKEWKTTSQLNATPTILINGYEMPNNYQIEDLVYFSDLVLDTK